MSDFLANLARRGAGLAPIVRARPAVAEPPADAIGEAPLGPAPAAPPAVRSSLDTPATHAPPHAYTPAPPPAPASAAAPIVVSAAPTSVIRRVVVERPAGAPHVVATATVAPEATTVAGAIRPIAATDAVLPAPSPVSRDASPPSPPAPKAVVAPHAEDAVRPRERPAMSIAAPAASETRLVTPAARDEPERMPAPPAVSPPPASPAARTIVRTEREVVLATQVPAPAPTASAPVVVTPAAPAAPAARPERALRVVVPDVVPEASVPRIETGAELPDAGAVVPVERSIETRTLIEAVRRVERVELQPVPRPAHAAPATAEPAADRVVHVRIGTIEIQTAPASAPASAPPAQPAAPVEPGAGFDAFARLRTYAPWQR